MALTWPPKDPDEVKDYDLHWNNPDDPNPEWADGDTITASDWIVDSGSVVVDSKSYTNMGEPMTKVWLSGGTIGEACVMTNRVTTAGSRTLDQTVKFKIKAK